ncbi:MAG: PD-(D/E)XK nuclease family protein, partial [Nitrospirales bacterium]
LNEKLFPRFIREDAFLRDRARRVLDETLGFKIDEKLAGYDEEILLFTLLVGAARHRLYLVYQRGDADGRALAPSFYLVPWLSRDGRLGAEPPVRVPRSLAERRGMPHFAPSYLTREELAVTLVLDGLDPSRLLEAVGRGPVLFQTGWQALLEIEGDRPRGGPHDGFLASPDRFWQALAARGVAPTPLEQYARCPFQYFAAQVLRLKAVRFEKTEEVPAQVFGELCHRVLRGCYRHLLRDGWPTRVLTAEAIRDRVRTVTDDVSRGYVLTKGTGYPLLWELALDTVAALVSAAVESDQAEFRASGYRPLAFEVLGEGTLEGVGEPGVLPLRGRLDRVDQDPARSTWRVVDYKFRQSRRITSQDRDLVTAALRGYRLQPPLYTRMTSLHTGQDGDPGRPLEGKVTDVRFLYLAPHWEPMVQSSTFSSEVWGGDTGSSLRQTLRVVLDGIREGRFFILPDTYCDFCDFAPACRRFHGPTWWRARAAPGARALRELRRKKGTP